MANKSEVKLVKIPASSWRQVNIKVEREGEVLAEPVPRLLPHLGVVESAQLHTVSQCPKMPTSITSAAVSMSAQEQMKATTATTGMELKDHHHWWSLSWEKYLNQFLHWLQRCDTSY